MKIEHKVTETINGFNASFTIMNQTFLLEACETIEEAEWFSNNLKIAFEKLTKNKHKSCPNCMGTGEVPVVKSMFELCELCNGDKIISTNVVRKPSTPTPPAPFFSSPKPPTPAVPMSIPSVPNPLRK
jgi:hypothetical protein